MGRQGLVQCNCWFVAGLLDNAGGAAGPAARAARAGMSTWGRGIFSVSADDSDRIATQWRRLAVSQEYDCVVRVSLIFECRRTKDVRAPPHNPSLKRGRG